MIPFSMRVIGQKNIHSITVKKSLMVSRHKPDHIFWPITPIENGIIRCRIWFWMQHNHF